LRCSDGKSLEHNILDPIGACLQLVNPSLLTAQHGVALEQRALVDGKGYTALYDRSLADPGSFWLEQARRLDWIKRPEIAGDWSFDKADFRNLVPRFTEENRRANQALIDLIGKFAQEKKATPAQVALAWLLDQKPWIVPIPGTTKLHRLEENLRAASLELSREDLRQLESSAAKVEVQGARYPEALQKFVGR